jgi:hypothetical protein
MTSRVSRSTLAVVLASLVLATPVVAQIRVELGGTIGAYLPQGRFQPAPVGSTLLAASPDQLSGMALGGQLRVWIARVGVQLSATTTSSRAGGGSTPEGYFAAIPARVSTRSALLLFRLTGDGGRSRVWLGAGAGAIRHGGPAYEPFGTPINYGGVIGLGSAIHLIAGLSADLGVTSMIYDLNIRGTAQTDPRLSERGRQVDLLLHTGLSYSWH